MIPKVATGFRKRSCSNREVERDDDQTRRHRALGRESRPRRRAVKVGSVSEAIPVPAIAAPRGRGVRGRLFRKYVALFVAVVCVALFDQRPVRDLVLLSGAQGLADPHPARAGRGRGRQDRPVHQGDRGPGRLDHATAVVGGHARAAPLRRAAPAAPGAGDHRAGAARCHRQGAAAGVAARHGRGRQRADSPRTRNSPRRWRRRSITARSISAASPSPT